MPPIYLDNHATTRTDPRVVDAMLPFFSETYGNSGSSSHAFGWEAKEAVDRAREFIADRLGAMASEIVFTSGATESNNLAIRGVCEQPKRQNGHIISVATEHPAVLDPLRRLARRGWEIELLPIKDQSHPDAGRLELDRLENAIRDDTVLVSVMLANNEIGVLQPLEEIGRLCKQKGVLLHCDATQAVGRIPVHVETLNVDLLSFSGHKIYGPKGVGALYVRRRKPRVRLAAQIEGGRQENGFRSGTLNVGGIVGLAKALALCLEELPQEEMRLRSLRDRLYQGVAEHVPDCTLNGPLLEPADWRLAHNLNLCFGDVDGEALMMSMKEIAVSSGSACTSAAPEPSRVLLSLGKTDDQARASLRFGLGRFNTAEEIEFTINSLNESLARLRQLKA